LFCDDDDDAAAAVAAAVAFACNDDPNIFAPGDENENDIESESEGESREGLFTAVVVLADRY
jgi:hypothetical protein